MNRHPAYPSLFILAATFVWSTSGIFVRILGFPAATLAFFRSVVPVVAVGILFSVRRYRPSTSSLGIKLGASAINTLRMLLYFYGYIHTSIANAVIALYTWPIFSAIIARYVLGERVSRQQALLLGMAFCGIPLLYLGNDLSLSRADVLGITAMLGAALLHALTVILLKKVRTGNDPFESILFQNLGGAIAFIPALWIPSQTFTGVEISIVLLYALTIGFLGYALFFAGLHRTPAATASNIAYFEVVGAILLAWAIFGEVPEWNTILGGALITISVIMAGRRSV